MTQSTSFLFTQANHELVSNWEDEAGVFLRDLRKADSFSRLCPLSPRLPPSFFQILWLQTFSWLTLKCCILQEILILLFKLKQGLPGMGEASQRDRNGNHSFKKAPKLHRYLSHYEPECFCHMERGLFAFFGGICNSRKKLPEYRVYMRILPHVSSPSENGHGTHIPLMFMHTQLCGQT
jgi:hypothetical protein